jgi:hypothetical protein
MDSQQITPARLAVRLILYFVVFFGAVTAVVTIWPATSQFLPVGGHDALDRFGVLGELLEVPGSTSEKAGQACRIG